MQTEQKTLTARDLALCLGWEAIANYFTDEARIFRIYEVNVWYVGDGDRLHFAPSKVKPIARRISDLTEEEARHCFLLSHTFDVGSQTPGWYRKWWADRLEATSKLSAKEFSYLLFIHICPFPEWFDAGLVIDKATLENK
jgi:hypothetical protein